MSDKPEDLSLHERWQNEQREWQQLITSFIDRAAMDESFLVHMGKAMRGSLLAGKPYPAMSSDTSAPPAASLDEVIFSVRRLEAQVADLVQLLGDRDVTRGAGAEQ